jgi:hypothetical protein
MQIDDILKLEKFKELDELLNKEMRKYAGEKLIKRMKKVFYGEAAARDWFYSKLLPLGGKRPYDYCRTGRIEIIERELERIDKGVF